LEVSLKQLSIYFVYQQVQAIHAAIFSEEMKMIKRVFFLFFMLMVIPFAATAVEVISNDELETITGASGIVFDELANMSLEEIHKIVTFEEIQSLPEEERQELREILKKKFDALSKEEKARLREQMRKWLMERICNMTPEEREKMNRQLQSEGLVCMPLEENRQFRERMQERMIDITSEELDQIIQMRRQVRRVGCCPNRR
jgi:hypothetical protein